MLSNWEADYIQSLMHLIETQSKETLATWAMEYARENLLPLWVAYFPEDHRPRMALEAGHDWVEGIIKLPVAKKIILECHSAARDAEEYPVAQAAARAIAQSASTIHSARHCIGLAFYGALAISYSKLGIDAKWTDLESYAAGECKKMEEALEKISVKDEKNPAKISWKC